MVRGRDGGISRQHNPRFIPAVFRNRWTFMKRSHKLAAPEREALEGIFQDLPKIGVTWLLKEAFASIYRDPIGTKRTQTRRVGLSPRQSQASPN